MSRIILYGGTGFVGRHLANALAERNLEVIVFGREKNAQTQENDEVALPELNSNIQLVHGNFANTTEAVSLLKAGDIVFDLVASSVPFSSMLSPVNEVQEHVFPHVQFIEAAYQKNIAKLIFTSSGGGVYGDKSELPFRESDPPQPVSPYAISKLSIEHFLAYFARIHKSDYLIYRLSNPYGPGQKLKQGFGLIPTLFSMVLQNQVPTLYGNGDLIRDFIYIDDVVEAILVSFDKKHQHNLYNIGSGVGVSVNELWQSIQRLTHTSLKPSLEPQRLIDATQTCLDISRIRAEFGWLPSVNLETGLAKTWQTVAPKNAIIL